ncbi:hypothetical protein HYQ46_000177 [Verticillium longisporum]|nr:hypothetical protein HYQ44_015933 [Verticillium longisporum]KAG7150856.1 hypothetical protein HYQ46_000177 [Verticillium longisporum]
MVTVQTSLFQLYPTCQVLNGFLCEYLIVIVKMCQNVAIFMNHSYVSKIWSSFTKSFDKEFKTFEDDIRSGP